MRGIQDDSHVGGTGGAAAHPPSDDAAHDGEAPGTAGDIEIPIGAPVNADEFRRLKDAARDPRRVREEEDASEVQEDDAGRDKAE